jgi:hypothetical protein
VFSEHSLIECAICVQMKKRADLNDYLKKCNMTWWLDFDPGA